ncbi:MAG: hypothetical protein K0S56_2400 [Microvirga sp.]|nr:hypothetical protein [Microvirga sp.]
MSRWRLALLPSRTVPHRDDPQHVDQTAAIEGQIDPVGMNVDPGGRRRQEAAQTLVPLILEMVPVHCCRTGESLVLQGVMDDIAERIHDLSR